MHHRERLSIYIPRFSASFAYTGFRRERDRGFLRVVLFLAVRLRQDADAEAEA